MRFAVLALIVFFSLGDGCSAPAGVVGVQDYGKVTGRVLDAMTNRPIPAALVSVGSLYTAQADARGGFTIATVPTGDQTVTARAPGYTTDSADVTIRKDKTADAGYIRLVPVIHPEGQSTLPPPVVPTPTPPPPTPAPSVTPASAVPPASAASPAAAVTPAASATP